MDTTKSLCKLCQKIDPARMLAGEVNEIEVGLVTDYNKSEDCSFCALISKAVSLAGSDNPNLNSQFSSFKINTKLFIQSRSPVTIKVNGRMEYPAPQILLATDQQPSNHQKNRPPLREIDRSEDRFIFAEIEHLPDDVDGLIRRRAISTLLNVPLLQKWLRNCKGHEHSTNVKSYQDQFPLRLIDVVQECLTVQPEWCEYMALSYTWGKSVTILQSKVDPNAILVASKDNLKSLHVPRALSPAQRNKGQHGIIPSTICDAMELARRVGIQYLWVDTLCIVQDSQQDRSRLISSMDTIYNSSTLTIIAAAGDDPHAGLHGISPRDASPMEPYKISDPYDGKKLSLSLCLPSLCQEVRKGKWYTRGWTYQEQCLSQRCLYFTSTEVFFQCPKSQWREGYDYGEDVKLSSDIQIRTGPPWWSKRLRKDPDPTPYRYLGDVATDLQAESYQMAVQEYTRRNLSSESDVLNAFEGIFHQFNRLGDASDLSILQTQGIPAYLLLQAILWFPSESSQRRETKSTPAGKVVQQFSSWSWTSWVGPIEFIFADSLWLSRSISYAPRKGLHLHVCIPQWRFGKSKTRIWSSPAWKAAGTRYRKTGRLFPDTPLPSEFCLGNCIGLDNYIGIDLPGLLHQSLMTHKSTLKIGQLGFVAPYLRSRNFVLSDGIHRSVKTLSVYNAHRGDFRFDNKRGGSVDELVLVLCTNTVLKPPRTVGVFLGLTTSGGISRRVGIGFLYFSEDLTMRTPAWEYKVFTVQ